MLDSARSHSWLFAAGLCLAAILALVLLAGGPQSGPAAAAGPTVPAVLADLTLEKHASPLRVLNGGLVTYTVLFSNSALVSGTLQAITDTLDAGLVFDGMAAGSQVLTPPQQISGSLVWTGTLEIPPQGSLLLSYRVATSDGPGWSYPCNRVEASLGVERLGPVQACITVGPEEAQLFLPLVFGRDLSLPRFTIAKEAFPELVTTEPGQLVTYTVTIRNEGGMLGRVSAIYDTLPPGFTYLDMVGGDLDDDPAGLTGTITWSGPFDLAPGAQLRLVYLVSPSQQPDIYTNSARLEAFSPVPLPPPASATVTVEPAILLQDDFNTGMDRWTAFLNYPRLEEGQWYWGPADGVDGTGAATQDCCIGDKEAADALLMYLQPGAEEWTDYRVEVTMNLRGGVDKDGNWTLDDGDPIGLWVRGQYEESDIRAQWVTGYYVVLAGKPDGDYHAIRINQLQTLTDCFGDACNNPWNLYNFNNPYPLAEVQLSGPYYRNRWYTLAVEVRGPIITVFLDGQPVLEYEDTKEPFLTGTVGFKTHETQTASFDNILVTPLH